MFLATIVRFTQNCFMNFDTGTFHFSDGHEDFIDGYVRDILKGMTETHRIFTRREIALLHWDEAEVDQQSDRAPDTQIVHVRRLDPALKPLFRTVRGQGYQYTGPLQQEEPDGAPAARSPQGLLTVTENSDWGPRPSRLTREPEKSAVPERQVPLSNADQISDRRPAPGRGWRKAMTIREALEYLEGWLDQAAACAGPEELRVLTGNFRSFFDIRCLHLEPLELQQLHGMVCNGLAFFSTKTEPVLRQIWSLLDKQEFALHVRILEAKIRLCDEGLAAARLANQTLDVERFTLQRQGYMEDLDETYRSRGDYALQFDI